MEHIFSKLVDQFIGGRLSRRDLIQSLAAVTLVGGGAAIAATPARRETKCISINHLSYRVKDYAKSRDFYVENFGMKVSHDDGEQAYLSFGDSFMVVRSGKSDQTVPLIDHLGYNIGGYGAGNPSLEAFKPEYERMGAELTARGLSPREDGHGLTHMIKDPDGLTVQVCPPMAVAGNPTFEKGMALNPRHGK